MSDRYLSWTASGPGGFVAARLGLPRPEPLRRRQDGVPDITGPVLLGATEGGRLVEPVSELLADWDVPTREAGSVDRAGRQAPDGTEARGAEAGDAPAAALVFDATGIRESARLGALHSFFHTRVRSLAPCGRVVVLGTPPELAVDPGEAAAQRALEGFVRSVGKELRRGATAHLLLVAPGAEETVGSPLRFALSARSAYVSGQVLRVAAAEPAIVRAEALRWDRPLDGRIALVTGASRGIGATVAETLARDGARVVCLDVPAQSAELRAVAARLGGDALEIDLTAPDAPAQVAAHLREQHGGVDVVVHNAGITRDRTLGRMEPGQWDAVVAVNLTAVERLTDALLTDALLANGDGDGDEGGRGDGPGDGGGNGPVLRAGGRIVCTSSISGIAGNVGQSNYAASKAGLIGLVEALAPSEAVAGRGITVNAVAPGFIETQMTAAVPLFIREAGRRLNSLKQGGQPVDVAEAVAFLAAPASAGISGQVLRVCGQALLGA
ncbi:3-oxoacyl-ACP reductase [Streptacidiphilus rugosus]|uniref:3-oxoacyl-ACP reductase n=1 Tax=Streptacidiphilus rugosus TaxID=405783 RepID=UPI00055BAA45|nr:3-oxoacyl-ACP reductase [Streptacidiphilus rugosus]